jgi:ribosomal protein S18 acetylase RimI-like enzyme
MNVEIRPATAVDYDNVNRIFTSELAHHVALLPDRFQMVEPVMSRQWFADLLAQSNKMLQLALVDDLVVGLILLIESVSQDDAIYRPRRYLEVDELAVLPDYRRLGIGRRLMQAAEEIAAQRGIPAVELHVWEDNQLARAFYDRLGYRTIRRRLIRHIQ